jgi:hypothetical protein
VSVPVFVPSLSVELRLQVYAAGDDAVSVSVCVGSAVRGGRGGGGSKSHCHTGLLGRPFEQMEACVKLYHKEA